MRVFVSWSGDRSRHVALLLKEWLSCVVQACQPWISARDIERGALWFSEISEQLRETSVGIICLTAENKDKPWILFEAGALAKGVHSARVCTFLIDLETSDIGDPLAQFNHTKPTHDDLYLLVKTVNSSVGQQGLSDDILRSVFETYWPKFEEKFLEIINNTESSSIKSEPRPQNEVLNEILDNTRMLASRVRRLEAEIGSTSSSRFSERHLVGGREYNLSAWEARRKIGDYLASGVEPSVIHEIMKDDAPATFIRSSILNWLDEAKNKAKPTLADLLGELGAKPNED
ncbi:MAG: toll-Interleukin receptor [Rhodobacteraceae bacterium PARR1]|nr:MAG: toll-Interleukin receptor [Rhodobacteraceae bacterium PARR1]